MRSELVRLDWDGLSHLKRALPAIVRLRNGSHMVLLRVDGDADNARIVLRDPNAAEDALLVIDQPRFEDIWSGDVVLVKRNYEISDESQPFSIGLVAALLFRERRMVRDVAISALILGFLGLAPIMFWRLLSDMTPRQLVACGRGDDGVGAVVRVVAHGRRPRPRAPRPVPMGPVLLAGGHVTRLPCGPARRRSSAGARGRRRRWPARAGRRSGSRRGGGW